MSNAKDAPNAADIGAECKDPLGPDLRGVDAGDLGDWMYLRRRGAIKGDETLILAQDVRKAAQPFIDAAVAAERAGWKAKAIEACNRAGDGPDNGCCPTYWEEAREACIAAIQKA